MSTYMCTSACVCHAPNNCIYLHTCTFVLPFALYRVCKASRSFCSLHLVFPLLSLSLLSLVVCCCLKFLEMLNKAARWTVGVWGSQSGLGLEFQLEKSLWICRNASWHTDSRIPCVLTWCKVAWNQLSSCSCLAVVAGSGSSCEMMECSWLRPGPASSLDTSSYTS